MYGPPKQQTTGPSLNTNTNTKQIANSIKMINGTMQNILEQANEEGAVEHRKLILERLDLLRKTVIAMR